MSTQSSDNNKRIAKCWFSFNLQNNLNEHLFVEFAGYITITA